MRDQRNTFVVIEHYLDAIKTADWIVETGPEGTDGGGARKAGAAGPSERVIHRTAFEGRARESENHTEPSPKLKNLSIQMQ